MLMCRDENCTCLQHQILDYLKKGLNEEAKLALEKLENLCELTDASGSTFLHHSVKHGNLGMTQHLIDQGCKVNAQDDFGVTPLMLAVKAIDVMTIEVLLKNKADIYATDTDGTSSIELAFYLHDKRLFEILDLFFDKVNNDFLKGELMPILHNASDSIKFVFVVFGSIEMASFIVKNCYSIAFREAKEGRTAHHYAILYVRFENVKMLIEHGANIDALDKFDCTPFRYYTMSRFEDVDENLEVLKVFLKYSTRLSVPGEYGFTDIENVLSSVKKETVRAVLLSDIDLDACFRGGRFLLYILTTNRNEDVLDILDELDIKFDVNERTADGSTALMTPAVSGCVKKLEFLLKHNADVNLKTYFGYSALTYTDIESKDDQENHAKVIELLLQHGADAQTFFSDRPHLLNKHSLGAKVIVAQLAMLGALEQSPLTDSSRNMIASQPQLKAYFDLCSKQLEALKYFEIYGTVTMFKLLGEKEETIAVYARNAEIVAAFRKAMEGLFYLEQYYVNTLQRRVSRGLDLAKLQKNVALVIKELTGLCADAYHAIVYKIINYLNYQDLQNLCDISISHSFTRVE